MKRIVKAIFSVVILTLSNAVAYGNTQVDMVCLETIKTVDELYLNMVHESVTREPSYSSRVVKGVEKLKIIKKAEEDTLNDYFKDKRQSSTYDPQEEKVLRLYSQLNIEQVKFFICELAKNPRITKGTLIADRGMTFCRTLLVENKSVGSSCMKN